MGLQMTTSSLRSCLVTSHRPRCIFTFLCKVEPDHACLCTANMTVFLMYFLAA